MKRCLVVTAVAMTAVALSAAPARAQDIPPVFPPPVCQFTPGYNVCASASAYDSGDGATANADTHAGASAWGLLPRTLTYYVPYAAGSSATGTTATAGPGGATAEGSATTGGFTQQTGTTSGSATYTAAAG